MKKIQDIENKIPIMAKFLNKMFQYSRTNIQDVDFDDEDWFTKHTYTQEDEDNFKEYLVRNINGYKELGDKKNVPNNHKARERIVGLLLLQGGLRVKEDEN